MLILLFYCCVTNHPKIYCLKETIILFAHNSAVWAGLS